MQESEINELASRGFFQRRPLNGKVEEKHISWVILTKGHAFKIKKPLKLSFLDFSTLKLRKHFCDREVTLNKRFTNIYQRVIPIRKVGGGQWHIGGKVKNVADYAVQMKRLMSGKRMDNLLKRRVVNANSIRALAKIISRFHKNATVIDLPFNMADARNTFNDIFSTRRVILKNLGPPYAKIIDQSVRWSNSFLKVHAKRLQQRIECGFKRDVHGDLHSGNIFLYRKPVLFDCIEFSDKYRQIDLLYELAFLSMDLEAFRRRDLATVLVSTYAQDVQCLAGSEDQNIFIYFKCLRANVRAKVHAMNASQADNQAERMEHSTAAKKYLDLMKVYMNQIR
jgi:aminoglycoside phosphotransferase family enzyme